MLYIISICENPLEEAVFHNILAYSWKICVNLYGMIESLRCTECYYKRKHIPKLTVPIKKYASDPRLKNKSPPFISLKRHGQKIDRQYRPLSGYRPTS